MTKENLYPHILIFLRDLSYHFYSFLYIAIYVYLIVLLCFVIMFMLGALSTVFLLFVLDILAKFYISWRKCFRKLYEYTL